MKHGTIIYFHFANFPINHSQFRKAADLKGGMKF